VKKEEVRSLASIYLERISKYYGLSPFQAALPYLSLETNTYGNRKDKSIVAEYCSTLNEIQIYYRNIVSVEQLVKTLVHEYQHYLQSPSWMKRYYKMGHTYDTHPYEIKAYKEEENWIKFN
jgi:hypothetical protein